MARDKEDKEHLFAAGEKVFAKVKGYRAWPAYIEREEKLAKNRVKYHVIFYHTNEKACCKPEDIYPYGPFKEKYGKPTKVPSFNRALELIEKDSPDLTKFSLAEKLSAVQADVEEIQKNTKKRALEEGGEETRKATKKLVVDESDIEETPINSKKRAVDEAELEEVEESSNQVLDESGGSDAEKKPKRQKLVSESSEHSTPKKSSGMSDKLEQSSPKKSSKTDNSGLSNKDSEEDVKKDEKVNSVETSHQKRKSIPKKKLVDTPPFRPKTVYGEDPEIHLKKVQLLKKSKEKTKVNEEKMEVSLKSEKSMNRERTKKDGKKAEKVVQKKKEIAKGKKQRVSKQNEKNSASQEVASIEQCSSQQGAKHRVREQFDVVHFEKGDHVFARVKGYPAWPAVVTGTIVEKKKKRYIVSFFASMQIGHCPAEHLFPYDMYKEQYGYPRIKNSSLIRAFELIEEAAGEIKQKKGIKSNVPNKSAKNLKDNTLNGDISSNESEASGKDKSSVVLPVNGRGRQKKAVATGQ